MLEIEMLLRLLLSIGLGALVGAEREKFAKQDDVLVFGGIRTFIFISLLGALSLLIAEILEEIFPRMAFWIVIMAFIGFVILVAIGYYTSIMLSKGKSIGVTGEIAALLMFLIGMLVMTEYLFLAIALAILMAIFLYLKQRIHGFLKKISEQEMYSTFIFAVIAFVILPFLPNETFGPLGVLNPYKIWLMVVFICGLGYVGYILVKIFGSKAGIGLTGLLGGMVSSTAVTMSMAQDSKKESNISIVKLFVLAAIIANSVMFVRVLIEVYVVNPPLLTHVLGPILTMAVVALGSAWYLWIKRDKTVKEHHKDITHKSPFRVGPALQFGLLFAVVLLIIKAAQTYLGSTGVYIASLIAGFVDVDAITLSMANIAGQSMAYSTASTAIILAVMSNTAIKFGYAAIFGSKEFRKRLGIVMLLIVLSGLLSLWIF